MVTRAGLVVSQWPGPGAAEERRIDTTGHSTKWQPHHLRRRLQCTINPQTTEDASGHSHRNADTASERPPPDAGSPSPRPAHTSRPLADRAQIFDASVEYERVRLQLDWIHGDYIPGIGPVATDERNAPFSIAELAIEDLVEHGVDALQIELVLDMLDAAPSVQANTEVWPMQPAQTSTSTKAAQ